MRTLRMGRKGLGQSVLLIVQVVSSVCTVWEKTSLLMPLWHLLLQRCWQSKQNDKSTPNPLRNESWQGHKYSGSRLRYTFSQQLCLVPVDIRGLGFGVWGLGFGVW